MTRLIDPRRPLTPERAIDALTDAARSGLRYSQSAITDLCPGCNHDIHPEDRCPILPRFTRERRCLCDLAWGVWPR